MQGVLRLVLAVLVLSLGFAGCAPNYSSQDLNRMNAIETIGIVTEQSRGSFVLQQESGEERIFRTSQSTQYVPENFRSQKDDKVKVTFIEIMEHSGKIKSSVMKLEALEVAPQNIPPSEPIVGVILSTARGSSRHVTSILVEENDTENRYNIYVPSMSNVLKREGNSSYLNVDKYQWYNAKGKKVAVKIKNTPILRGNGYVYEAVELILLK